MFKKFKANRAQRDFFQQEGLIPKKIHPTLAGSWLRSREHGVDPFIEVAPPATDFLQSDTEELLLKSARPYFDYFGKLVAISECVLALSNARGAIIHLEGRMEQKIRKLAERHNFLVGADWNEKAVGTNAIGTAITEKTNMLIHAEEHFSYAWHPYSCAASPVFDRASGEIIGVVDATSFSGSLHLHTIGWVAAVARLIEADYNKIVAIRKDRRESGNPPARFYIRENPLQQGPVRILGNAPAFLLALNTACRVAKTDLGVLLTGATGTGKEMFARAIHHQSNRSEGPFVAVNCGAIPRELVYSELFGYVEGAFTGASRRGHPGRFEQADGGTILLDEIGDAPAEVQVGLLRVIEEKSVYRLGSAASVPVNVRILAATSRDLQGFVKQGKFREDLYYRLSGVNIEIPPLKERGLDILLLADFFLNEAAAKLGRATMVIDDQAGQALLEYHWPGNVRELKNLMDRLAALTEDSVITLQTLAQWGPRGLKTENNKDISGKELMIRTIKGTGGNITKAAEQLGINRTTVYRKIKKYGINIYDLKNMNLKT
jgi:transcriptional regulator of acetoin/glycerol metabolism